jgi:hypothetical protein
MAKKVAETEQEAPGLSEVIRKALAQLGTDASGPDVKEWIGRNYQGMTYNDSTFNSTLSTQRKKLRESDSSSTPAPAPSPALSKSQRATAAHLPTVIPTGEDLVKVKKIADQQGGIDELLKQVQTVHDLAAEVGGADKLLRCLEMLHEIVK